jgi:hypothetical protein
MIAALVLSALLVSTVSCFFLRSSRVLLTRSMANANVDLFGIDSVSLKLDGITSSKSAAASGDEEERKMSRSIADSITSNRTMKAEALRLEAELEQLRYNEVKLVSKMERLQDIDEAVAKLVKGEIALKELYTSPDYIFDEQFVLRIAELATMAKTKEEQCLFRGCMEELLKAEEVSETMKRVLNKLTKGG